MTAYLILTLLDVFQLCYFGETLMQQSSHIADALLRCPWYLCGGPFRRITSIILSNCTKPLVMTGGKFFILGFHKLSSVSVRMCVYFDVIYNICNLSCSNKILDSKTLDYESIIFLFHIVTTFGKIGHK